MAPASSVFLIAVMRLLFATSACRALSMTSSLTPEDASGRGNSSSGADRQRREVTNRKLIVTTILEEPYMMMKARGHFLAGNDRFEGYLADILQRLATSVGFQYETRLSRDGRYGELGPDGVWNGMIGEVQSGEADIAAGALIVTETLRQYVDFTEPFLSMRWSALLRRPTDAHNSRRAPASRGSATGSGRRQSVSSMSPPGGGMGPRRLTTATQLLRSDAVCGVVENSVAHQMIATSTDPVARALYQRMTLASLSASSHRGGSGHSSSSDPFVRSVQEGVDRARRENYAFILDSPTAEYVASREPCDLYTVEPFLDVATYAFAVRKQGPQSGAASSSSSSANHADDSRQLRQAIDREMRRMKQSGEMQAMYLRWWRDECAASVGAVDDEFAFVANSGTGRRPSQPDSADTYAGDVSRRHTRVSSVAAVPSSRLAGGADWRTVATVCCCVAVATTVAGISDLLTLFGLDKYYRR